MLTHTTAISVPHSLKLIKPAQLRIDRSQSDPAIVRQDSKPAAPILDPIYYRKSAPLAEPYMRLRSLGQISHGQMETI